MFIDEVFVMTSSMTERYTSHEEFRIEWSTRSESEIIEFVNSTPPFNLMRPGKNNYPKTRPKVGIRGADCVDSRKP